MGKGNDFVKNPQGSGGAKGGGQPDSYGKSRDSQQATSPEKRTNPEDRAKGPSTAAEAATPSNDRGGMLGTIADRATHKPFKLGGT